MSVAPRRDREFLTVEPATVEADFARVLDRIDAEGDRASAMGKWSVQHNASG